MPKLFAHITNKSSSSERTTILVVDDEKIIRELCAHALREYRVLQAGTCDEGLRMFEKEKVDLILSDIMMPGGSGLDLLKKVKALDPTATVLIMTGFVDKDIILNALKEDADDFINKPLNLIQLKTAVEKALERKALKSELADIKRSDQLKNNFLSIVSHKLRTPITGISLFLQNLKSDACTTDNAEFRRSLAMVSDETAYLGRLVDDLLVFSKVMVSGSGISKQLSDLNEVVADVLIKCREERGIFNIELETASESLPPVQMDVAKIRFALHQVIDNAIKFSGSVGEVSLRLGSHGDSVFVVISDTGIGIPESELAKVCEKFYQIDPEKTGQIRGFGLGLFYARDFVRQHGGSLSIVSEPGLGTTVTISLPLQ